jgi:hypothetical protein
MSGRISRILSAAACTKRTNETERALCDTTDSPHFCFGAAAVEAVAELEQALSGWVGVPPRMLHFASLRQVSCNSRDTAAVDEGDVADLKKSVLATENA